MPDTSKYERIINTLSTVNTVLLRTKDYNELAKKVSDTLCETAGYYFSGIGFFDQKNILSHFQSSDNTPEFEAFKDKALKNALPVVYANVLSAKQLYVIKEAKEECAFYFDNKKWTSFIAPLYSDNEVHGILCAAVPACSAEQATETSLFHELAQSIGHAISTNKEKYDLFELMTSFSDGYIIFDEQLNIVFVNEVICALFNRDKHYYQEKNFEDIMGLHLSGEEYNYIPQAFQRLQRGGSIEDLEIKYNNNVYILNTKNHSHSKYRMAVIRDITKERSEQKKLKKSETKYRTLFNAISDAIVIHPLGDNKVNTFMEVNEQACRQYGYTRNELLKLTVRDLTVHNEENIAISIENRKRLLQHGWTKCEVEQQAKNGEVFPVEVSSSLVDIEGEREILSLIRNISERKLAQEKLNASKDLLKTVLQNMPTGFLLIDENYVIRKVNEYTCNTSGYTPEELIGKEYGILCPSEKQSEYYPLYNKSIDAFTNKDTQLKCKNGELVPVLTNAQVIYINDKQYILESFQNTTQLKATECELIKAKEKAEESDRLKSAFLANMSHEIRTPMNSILGFSEQLKDNDISADEKEEYIDIIHTNGKRIQATINEILDIAKVESGIEDLKIVSIDLQKLMTDLFLVFKADASKKNLDFSFLNADDDSDLVIFSDTEKLNSMLSNLVNNAIKFTDEGKVSFGYSLIGTSVQFFVKDTGIGIPDDRKQKIFDCFVQADLSGARLFEGLGLGLSITKSYAKILGGTIHFESEENKGSTFYASIPTNQGFHSTTTAEPEQNNTEKQLSNKMKVLIVEDDSASAQLLTIYLRTIAGDILYADNGLTAIEITKTNPDIDLILMDVKLAKMNGFEAVEKIREFNQDVKVIAQTAFTRIEDSLVAFEVGCNDFITKPVSKKALLDSIQNLFED